MDNKFKPANPSIENQSEKIETAVQTCLDYLRIEDQPEKSEVIFILGHPSKAPTKKTAWLYKHQK